MPRIKGKDSKPLIYKATCKTTKKIYVGQTSNFNERKYDHIADSFNPNSKSYNTYFHRAIRKYGVDDFIWEIVEEFEKNINLEVLNEAEKKYIKLFDCRNPKGYNSTNGGSFLTTDTYKRISESQTGTLSHSYGKKGKDSYHRKPVMNITTGKKYDTMRELCLDEFGDIKYVKYISRVCSEKSDRDSYKGNKYCYLDKETMEPIIYEKKKKGNSEFKCKPIIFPDGTIYNSIMSISKKFNISERTIREILYGITTTSKKYPFLNGIKVYQANGETPVMDNTVPSPQDDEGRCND